MENKELSDSLLYIQGIKDSLNAIDKKIVRGKLPGNGFDKTAERNGLTMAYNILQEMLNNAEKST